jgi:hypothetical protein
VDQLRIIARGTGGDGRQLQLHQVFRAAQILEPPISAAKFFSVVASVASPLAMRAADHLEDLAVDGIEEMVGLHQRLDPVEHVVGRQDRAEKLLFGFDVVGQDAGWSVAAAPSDDGPPAGTGNCSFMGSPSPVVPRPCSRSRVLAGGVRRV